MTDELLSDERLRDIARAASAGGLLYEPWEIGEIIRELLELRAGPVMPETPSDDVLIASIYALRDFDRDLPTNASKHAYRAIRAALAREQSK